MFSDSVHRRLNAYALAAGAAGVGVLALAQPTEARIVYTPTHHVIGKNGRYGIDFNHDGIPDVTIFNAMFRSGSALINVVRAFPSQLESGGVEGGIYKGSWPGTFFEAALMRGARIGYLRTGPPFYQRGVMVGQCVHGTHNSAPPCSSRASNMLGSWANVKDHYIGVTFAVHGKTHYGWARLSVKLSRKPFKATAILTGYAYETIPNKAIIAGKTKGPDETSVEATDVTLNMPGCEPASLGLLAMGAPGLSIWRREELAPQ
jgi:catechol 2,3-dioxygenase-like lactoylglutathione lyase family enzyme